MQLNEALLRDMLKAYRDSLKESYAVSCSQDINTPEYKEHVECLKLKQETINRVLNGKEPLIISDNAVLEYLKLK